MYEELLYEKVIVRTKDPRQKLFIGKVIRFQGPPHLTGVPIVETPKKKKIICFDCLVYGYSKKLYDSLRKLDHPEQCTMLRDIVIRKNNRIRRGKDEKSQSN